jgi:hypothetical protein
MIINGNGKIGVITEEEKSKKSGFRSLKRIDNWKWKEIL